MSQSKLTSVCPVFQGKDLEHSLDFYTRVMGFESGWKRGRAAGYRERVAAAGAKVVAPLADRFYGMRDGRIEDPDGDQLSLGEAIEGA